MIECRPKRFPVFRQKHQTHPGVADRRSHGLCLVRAEIVEDLDVARLEGGREELFDIGAEAFAVDRPVEQAERFDAIVTQGRQESRGLPVAMRHLVDEPFALRRPAAQTVMLVFGVGSVSAVALAVEASDFVSDDGVE